MNASERPDSAGGDKPSPHPTPQPQVVVQAPPPRRSWKMRLLLIGLLLSVMVNVGMYSAYEEYFSEARGPQEKYRSGSKTATAKLALVEISGTIMPPYTERYLKMIRKAEDDENVKGLVLVVDSPGGLVADSHEIYHALRRLESESNKPIVVVMKRLAASGGYYVSMGAGSRGRVFAEPTTWTGSIGVIIPYYNATELAEKVGIQSQPLKTGELKDALSPFRPLSEKEREVWNAILDDAFQRFVSVIAENRKTLDADDVKELATGQVYTAEQAKANGLIDEIGYEEDAIEALKQQLGLEAVRVVRYHFQPGLTELLSGSIESRDPSAQWRALLEATVPRAMYYCSWAPVIGTW